MRACESVRWKLFPSWEGDEEHQILGEVIPRVIVHLRRGVWDHLDLQHICVHQRTAEQVVDVLSSARARTSRRAEGGYPHAAGHGRNDRGANVSDLESD